MLVTNVCSALNRIGKKVVVELNRKLKSFSFLPFEFRPYSRKKNNNAKEKGKFFTIGFKW